MKPNRPIMTFLCAATLAVLAGFGRAAEADRPNILFILADDLGWSDVGCYGQQRWHTPHIDRLASEGMRLPNN